MKKAFLVAIAIFFISISAFAQTQIGLQNQNVGIDQRLTVNQGSLTQGPVTQTQGPITQTQGAVTQNQDVGQNVKQEINIEKPFIQTPIVVPNLIPQLSFGDTKMIKPVITDKRLKEWNGEIIIAIVKQKKTTSSKIIEKTIDIVNESGQKEDLTKCRIIALSHPSTKMWSTGGTVSAGGVNTVGSGMMSGAAGIFPSYGRMTSDNVIDLIIVRVVE